MPLSLSQIHSEYANIFAGIGTYAKEYDICIPEVGKAQLEAQNATSATSAIAEVALRFNFLF